MSDAKSDFDVAKAVSDLLSGIEKERQQRVLRWVAESLDITLHIKAHVAADPAATPTVGVPLNATPSVVPRGAATDIKTFMEEKKPKSDTQFAAATAYYYRFEAAAEEKKESINADVLQDAARLAGRARFSKPLVTLNNAKKQGYVDASERGAFKINSVGENLVAMTLPGAQNSSQPKPRRPSKQKSAAKRKRA
jgi:hypothetical protein